MEGEDEDSGWVQMSAIDSVRQAVRLRLLADPSLAEKGQNHKGFHGDEVYAPNQHLYGVDKKIKGSKRDGASSTPATYTVIFDENGQPEPFVSALSEIRYTVETTGHDVIDFCIATGGGPGSWDGKRFRLRKQKNELQATKKKFMGILSQAQSSQVAPVVQTRAPTSAAALGTVAGTFDFSPHQEKPCAHFVTVPVLPKSKQYKSRVDPHLLRFYFERKIGLKRPKVLLSLTGGAVDFDMTSEHKDKLLAGITEASKSVDAWFVTGGTDKGIMKYVGEARNKFAAHVPLIGIATLSVLKGASSFAPDRNPAPRSPESAQSARRSSLIKMHKDSARTSVKCFPVRGYDAEARYDKEDRHPAGLDEHHSHFILADDGEDNLFFGKETRLRADFEAAISYDESDKLGSIYRILKSAGYGWEGMHTREDSSQTYTFLDKGHKVPVVCICVQGGPGSIQTVCDALTTDTPALLVRGSGKAADLIADATLLQFAEGHCEGTHVKFLPKANMQPEQMLLLKLLELIQKPAEGDTASKEGWDYRDMIDQLIADEKASPLEAKQTLEEYKDAHAKHTGEGDCSCKRRKPGESVTIDHHCKLYSHFATRKPFSLAQDGLLQRVMHKYDLPAPKPGNASKLLAQALTAAATKKCWVYDLDDKDPDAPDFDGSLLRCLLNGLGWERSTGQLWQKLELAIRWKRVDVMEIILDRTDVKGDKKKEAIQRALHVAISLDRVEFVQRLFERGADPRELYGYDSVQVVSPLGMQTKGDEQIARWAELFKSYKGNKREYHVHSFSQDVKHEWRGINLSRILGEFFWKNSYDAGVLAKRYKPGSTTKLQLGIMHLSKWAVIKGGYEENLHLIQENTRQKEPSPPVGLKRVGSMKVAAAMSKAVGKFGKAGTRANLNPLLDIKEASLNFDSSLADRPLWEKHVQAEKQKMSVILLLAIYKDVLGGDFKYDLGLLGDCYLDLFFLMVLMNRVEMAKMLWKRAAFPVKAALTACALLRSMAGRSDVEPVARDKMQKSAEDFEDMAIGVQAVALDQDIQLAVEHLERPIEFWGGLTITDVAVRSGCERFVEECCKEALARRFAGDLMPYDQSLVFLPKYKSLTLCTATWLLFPIPFLGIMAPFLMNFNAPPVSDAFRPPTQHRTTPEGYPNDPQENAQWRKKILDQDEEEEEEDTKTLAPRNFSDRANTLQSHSFPPSNNLSPFRTMSGPGGGYLGSTWGSVPPSASERDMGAKEGTGGGIWNAVMMNSMSNVDAKKRRRLVNQKGHRARKQRDARSVMAKIDNHVGDGIESFLSDYDRNKLWYPTFSFLERWYCFMRAPVTVFLFHSVWYLIVAVVFTYFVVTTAQPFQEFHVSSEDRILSAKMAQWEVFVSVVFGGKLVTEMLQLFIQGPAEYMNEMWNTFDMLMILGFYIGLAVRLHCFSGACQDLQIPMLEGVHSEDLYLQLYCLSLCFLWISQLRVLSVHRSMGPLVLIFLNMCTDVANFFFMLCFFLIAFSVLIFGSGATTGMARTDAEAMAQCKADGEIYATCTPGWWFIRTVLQSFGEFSLDQMTNFVSIFWIGVVFVTFNLVLFNLLIALMSSTFERIQIQSERQWMINHYNSTNEYLRFAMALPSPLNVAGIFLEIMKFLYYCTSKKNRERLQHVFCGFTWSRSVAIFLSRNRSWDEEPRNEDPELSSSQTERREQVRLVAFLENARKIYNLHKENEERKASSMLGADLLIRKLHYEMNRKTGQVLQQQRNLELKFEQLERRPGANNNVPRVSLKPLPHVALPVLDA